MERRRRRARRRQLMKSKAESVRLACEAAGLALALLAASPAIKASGLSGTALAAGTPPAVAQPAGAASPEAPAEVKAAPADTSHGAADLGYHRQSYIYGSGGLRDPFTSLVNGTFISDSAHRLPDVGSLELLGVMGGDRDRFGLLEDNEGQGYVLRVGEPVVNGEV